VFLQSRYKVCRTLGVSRYRTIKAIVNYPVLQSWLQVVARLPRASKASDGGPGIKAVVIYPGAGSKAKNVTSLITLLSVLALVIYFCPLKDVCLSLLAE